MKATMCGFYFAAVVVYGQDIIRVPAGVYRIGGYAENRGIRTDARRHRQYSSSGKNRSFAQSSRGATHVGE